MIQIYKDPHFIDKFTIYGERHTGTKFLEQSITSTFSLNVTYFFGFKHWLGFCKPETITYKDRGTLFFGTTRHPYDWLNSFFNLPHHVPRENRNTFEHFLLNEWYSVNSQKQEITQDRNFNTPYPHTKYKNIFDLRKNKLKYLTLVMPEIAKNYVLVSYEFMTAHHEQFINLISNRFHLIKRGSPAIPIIRPQIILDTKIKEIIDSNIDWSLESIFGYYPR